MDRRHLVLGLAITATLATKYVLDPLFWGEESRNGPLVTLGTNHPVRMWQITYSTDLPGIADDHPFGGTIWVFVQYFSDRADDQFARAALVDCETDVLLTEDSVSDEQAVLEVQDAFPSCVGSGFCEQSYCLIVETTDKATPAQFLWSTSASIASDEDAERGEEDKVLDILIEYEELAL
jgi:hypothetical protein